MSTSSEASGEVRERGPELGVALFLLAIAGLVIMDSLRIGVGWSDDGPKAGYFPFYIGLFLGGSALVIAAKAVMGWAKSDEVFAETGQLKLVWAIFWPMVVFAGIVASMGLYVGSITLIAYFMIRHGKHRIATAAAVAIGVPLVVYLVFERWFLVPLPKGPIEALLGM